jgi:AdoMet-dependent rRNA methyltransferase SPB1
MKPNSSRSQSSEIFLICLDYISPTSIDSKLFDANFVFKEVNDPGLKKPDIFHKKYETSHKRQRSGYDETLGITLRNRVTTNQFITSMEPIRLLTDVNEIYFDLPASPSAAATATASTYE